MAKTTKAKTTKQPTSRTGIVWGIGIAAVVLIGIVAVLATRGSGEDDKAESPVVVTGTPLPVLADPANDPAVGTPIPAASGTTLAGDRITIGPDGTPKVILFVAHWCPHCQKEIPYLVDHLADSPLPDGVDLVTVSTAEKASAANYPADEWLDREGWTFPVLDDDEAGTVAQAFGLSAYPFFVAVDADGNVVGRTSGELTGEQFDALVQAAQGGSS